ncbi:hypothetical protein BEL04_15115 [Mucilaginibacter sp. PPCGB 2223]|uniref:hypothetical protein n=1 Tax=Mucilaginibacter sp. PPCGB 2223 TaxID=1886027 RepID=UPI000826E862|nr:hypothetical protein [Mucilaginibacter sp. PPCGB 2223]OCX51359.1 hypothetical protein BEL04_15115 [Mucilaginibacter sp. PPCGB 2223]
MHWCKASRYNLIGLFTLLLAAYGCKPDVKQSNGTLKYFDLSGYFKAEAARLSKKAKPVVKTVSYNGQAETKNILIRNWPRELDLFSSSDINKAAWKDSYNIAKAGDSVVYTAIDTNLHTRKMVIRFSRGRLSGVAITNFTKNMLYQTGEKLIYYPDSLYYIEKHQHVKLLGANNYQISGKF